MSVGSMRSIGDFAGQEMVWTQPSAIKREYELRAGEDLLGTLGFKGGTLANAEAAAGSWTFKREGFWRPRVTVRVSGDETNIASFRANAGGAGELTFSDGRVFRLASAHIVQPEWVWKREDQVAVSFKGPHGVIKANATVDIAPGDTGLPELALLVLLGWYLILLHARDTAAVATGAIVASRVAVVR